MREYRQFNGPFQKRLSFTPDEIDEICFDALQKSGYLPNRPEPVRIERFIEKYFACNVGYEDLPSGIMGYTLFDGKGKVLEVRVSQALEDGKLQSDRRIRSTWAHEGGHCLLHPSLFIETEGQALFGQVEKKQNRKILCRDNDIGGVGRKYDGKWWEWQANRCIGGLLLPKSLVKEALADVLVESVSTRIFTLPAAKRQSAEKLLAETFDVNPVVSRIRLSEMYPETRGQIEF